MAVMISTAAPAAAPPAIAAVSARCEEVIAGAAAVPEEDTRAIVVEPVPAGGPGSEGAVEEAVRQYIHVLRKIRRYARPALCKCRV